MDFLNDLTKTEALGLGGVIGAFLATYAIFAIAWAVLQIIARWKIFTKAGEEGWKAIIPVYNEYVQYKFTWETSRFWKYLIASFVLGVGEVISDATNEVVALLGALVVIASAIMVITYTIKEAIYLAKSFGKSKGFAVGLIFLQPIFMLILGFDDSKYEGNKSAE